MKSELSQDESGSESEDLQHSDVEESEEHTHEECDEDMVRHIWIEGGRHLYETIDYKRRRVCFKNSAKMEMCQFINHQTLTLKLTVF